MSIFNAFLNAAQYRRELLSDMVEDGTIPAQELRTEEFPFLPEPPRHRKPSDRFLANIANVDFHATAAAAPIGK